MAHVTITLSDTPGGGVAIHTDFKPAVGNPCSQAQAAALDIISRTRKQFGIVPADSGTSKAPSAAFRVGEIDIDAVHRSHDNVVAQQK